MDILERSVEDKKIIWFEESNRYSLLELPAYEVITRLAAGKSLDEVVKWCADYYDLPVAESARFVGEIQETVELQLQVDPEDVSMGDLPADAVPSNFTSLKNYQIDGTVLSVAYQDPQIEYLIHPKFAHLEVGVQESADHYFETFYHDGRYILRVNGSLIGQWLPEDAHYFTGKFSMELLNRMYQKTDADWMGVFHASAVGLGKECMLFLGDSGNGKSTLLAILMASGFDLVADDFVPVDAVTQEVRFFPAAVSVKKNAIDHLLPLYPQLASAAEFYYPGLDKTVRYLAPDRTSERQANGYPCKALVFVKYEKGSGMKLESMPKDIAFQHLVPDSWISPLPENAERFLDWFLQMPCYRLTYSDNEKMVIAIRKLFQHDL